MLSSCLHCCVVILWSGVFIAGHFEVKRVDSYLSGRFISACHTPQWDKAPMHSKNNLPPCLPLTSFFTSKQLNPFATMSTPYQLSSCQFSDSLKACVGAVECWNGHPESLHTPWRKPVPLGREGFVDSGGLGKPRSPRCAPRISLSARHNGSEAKALPAS